ncbi:hypothetical protein [Bradyrhizobium sp. AUGA SZCCT0182]|uniref:hypothetical protein n=1 Tax=Bradyrhizobium sp. AUGA SZCCT0182 TaxID=2807667 RepID=UPI00201294B4|nr:hypothetical protein [Bradyrhizobium sp. AUGA SZCCT0182]
MAAFVRLPSGSWRAVVRRKRRYISEKRLIKFGRDRAAQGVGPVTVSMDIGAVRLVISHAAAVHGLPVSMQQVDPARIALKRLGLVGKSNERDRRPMEEELQGLFKHFDSLRRPCIPMSRVMRFAIATAMCQEEIFRVTWDDYNPRTKMLLIRDRKDRREKKGNHQRIPLLDISGFNAVELIEEQRAVRSNEDDRIFPQTTNPPEPRSHGPAEFSGSSTCTSTTCGRRAPAACSKPAWRSSRPRS